MIKLMDTFIYLIVDSLIGTCEFIVIKSELLYNKSLEFDEKVGKIIDRLNTWTKK